MSAESPAYYAVRIITTDYAVENLLPEWPELGVESFMEEPGALVAYIPLAAWTDELEDKLTELLAQRRLAWEKEYIAPNNWNTVWEAGFDPVKIDSWCLVRAEFHNPDPQFQHEVIIRPQMAFGTGHHETTYMMLEWLRELQPAGKRVLDFGCGTGILAIMAAKLGASSISAVDIEPPAIENAREHAILNQTEQITWLLGGLEAAPVDPYELILANINRNVLLDSAPQLADMLPADGSLLLSGILKEDEAQITEAYQMQNLRPAGIRKKGNWLSILFRKPAS